MLLTIIKLALRPLFRLLFTVEYHGVSHVPAQGAVIIAGNHDVKVRKGAPGIFASIHDIAEVKIAKDRTVVLCHYPMREWPGAWHGYWHLFGHVHGRLDKEPHGFSMDVGVDTNDFRPYTIEEITTEAWQRMFDIHVKGAFLGAKSVVPGMKERRQGKIVNVSSIWGMVGHSSHSHYCGAKAALLGLTKAWAKELAPFNVMVNAIAPGLVTTEMVLKKGGMEYVNQAAEKVPLKRSADVIEMSYTVLFLSCHESDFVTGQVISPNGGDTIVGI